MKKWFRNMKKAIHMELREHKSSFIMYSILRIISVALMIVSFLSGHYQSGFLCLLTLILLIVPSFLQITLKVELPTVLEIILLLFIFAAEILGEIWEFYIIFPFWDTMLHTMNGFLAAAIGFSLVHLLNKSEKIYFYLSPLFTAILAFCFSMTIGVIWEFFEFAMDQLFLFDMQKDTVIYSLSTVALDPTGGNTPVIINNITDAAINGLSLGLGGYLDIGLIDTMVDLIVNFIGAFIFSVFGYIYVKTKGNGPVVDKFMLKKKKEERDFLKIVKENQQDAGKEEV